MSQLGSEASKNVCTWRKGPLSLTGWKETTYMLHSSYRNSHLLVDNRTIWTNRDQRAYRCDCLCATTQLGAIGGVQDLDWLVESDVPNPSPVVLLHNDEDHFITMIRCQSRWDVQDGGEPKRINCILQRGRTYSCLNSCLHTAGLFFSCVHDVYELGSWNPLQKTTSFYSNIIAQIFKEFARN